ncbi:hypothetical protein [Oceanobacillus senegalensis]|nr:hypothetical protein [Oceanobacillus senegalensis]
MRDNPIILQNNDVVKDGGYKVIEVNMSDASDSIYAVCTPVKMQ